MNDQYFITYDADRSILALSPCGEGRGGASHRARSDPSLPAVGRGDPQGIISILRIDPPRLFGSRGHPPEVGNIRNGPPAGSAQEPCERIASALFLRLAMTTNGTSLRAVYISASLRSRGTKGEAICHENRIAFPRDRDRQYLAMTMR